MGRGDCKDSSGHAVDKHLASPSFAQIISGRCEVVNLIQLFLINKIYFSNRKTNNKTRPIFPIMFKKKNILQGSKNLMSRHKKNRQAPSRIAHFSAQAFLHATNVSNKTGFVNAIIAMICMFVTGFLTQTPRNLDPVNDHSLPRVVVTRLAPPARKIINRS